MSRCFAWMIIFLAALSTLAQGPNEGFVMEAEGTSHLLSHSDPAYPPIAKAAHVQGSVLLHVSVNQAGKVTNIEIVGGSEMLRGAALEAVRHWTYTPFEENGKPKEVKVVVSVPFSLGIPSPNEKSDQAIASAFFPKDDECRNQNAAAQWALAVATCAEAVTIAERFPDPSSRRNEMRGAYQSDGVALLSSGDPAAALTQYKKAVAIANVSLTAKDAEYASAYLSQAIAEHVVRMVAEAEKDYVIAEDSYHQAIVNLPDMTKQYGFSLSQALAYHSILEQQTGQIARSNALRDEALRLNPHAMDRFGGAK